MKKINQNRWQHHLIKTQPDILSKDVLQNNIQQFFNQLVLRKDSHILLLVKAMFSNGRIASLNKLIKTDNASYAYDECSKNLDVKLDSYKFELKLRAFVFTYKIEEGILKESEILNIEPAYQIHSSNKFKLPITLDPLTYGKIKMNIDNHYLVRIDKNLDAKIVVDGDINRVTILRDGEPVLSYKDKKISSNSFERTIGRNVYLYEDNLLVLYSKKQSHGFIKQLHPAKNINEKFIAMDIETYNDGGVLRPYCVGIYGDNLCKSFYLSDYKNQEELLKDSVKSLFSEEYNGYKIYIHNLSNFDGIFLMKILSGLGKVSPIINEGLIINIDLEVALENKNIKISFRDSYQILTSSLDSLAKSFNIENKGLFPYDYVTPDNLNYVGSVPSISFFNEISLNQYKEYCDKFNGIWSLRDETIKYCLLDCKILYKVLLEYNKINFYSYNVNINSSPTAPSLGMNVFRTNYLPSNSVIYLTGSLAQEIKKGYTGGAVDMYIPYGENLFEYDKNSLYPSVMAKYDMPVGNPVYFEGDITKYDRDAFGFFDCNVKTPTYLEHPILQTHVKTKDGIRTVAPLGTWQGTYFSEEIKNALKFGYQFEILRGFTFSRLNIFNKYITDMYARRLSYPKNHPMNLSAKLNMNSTYGRFGMKDLLSETSIMSHDELNSLDISSIEDITEFGDMNLVTHKDLDKELLSLINEGFGDHTVNIAIPSAIAAYGRIDMSELKNNPLYKLYYSDTDSFFTDRPLPLELVSNTELGKYKLVHKIKKAIFLSPKVYCIITEDGQLICKVKGLNSNVRLTFEDFESLLSKDSSLVRTQTKWFKHIELGQINVKDQLYTLRATSNKRELVYDNDNKLVSTKPYIIDNNKVIISKTP